MRDVIKIFTAGSVLTAYALVVPTMVDAVPAGTGPAKAFHERLRQVEDGAPVSLGVSETRGVTALVRRPALSGASLGGSFR